MSHPMNAINVWNLMGYLLRDLLCKVDVHFWISGVGFEGFGEDVDTA